MINIFESRARRVSMGSPENPHESGQIMGSFFSLSSGPVMNPIREKRCPK